MAHVRQRPCQLPSRLQRPPQRRHRITPAIRLHQIIQIIKQRRVNILQSRPAPTLSPNPASRLLIRVERLCPLDHRVPRHPRSRRHQRLTTPPHQPGHSPSKQPPLLLIQMPEHEPEEPRQTLLAHLHVHTPKLHACHPHRADSSLPIPYARSSPSGDDDVVVSERRVEVFSGPLRSDQCRRVEHQLGQLLHRRVAPPAAELIAPLWIRLGYPPQAACCVGGGDLLHGHQFNLIGWLLTLRLGEVVANGSGTSSSSFAPPTAPSSVADAASKEFRVGER